MNKLIKQLENELFEKIEELKKKEDILLKEKEAIEQQLDEIYEEVQETLRPMLEMEQSFRTRCQEADMTNLICGR